jgi:hypothetical protein
LVPDSGQQRNRRKNPPIAPGVHGTFEKQGVGGYLNSAEGTNAANPVNRYQRKVRPQKQNGPTSMLINPLCKLNLAEWTGLEPATPGVTGRYSNQLNYHSWQSAPLERDSKNAN